MKFTKITLKGHKGCKGCTNDCKYNGLTTAKDLEGKNKYGCNNSDKA